MALRTSAAEMTTVLGSPLTRSRPRISVCSSSSLVVRGADRDLDVLGGALAEQEAVLLLDVLDDRVVQLVAGDPDGLGGDDAAERDDGDLGGAAADVHDHVAGGLVHREAGADGRGHRLLDDVHLAGARLGGRLDDGAALDAGDAGGHTDDDARPGQ